jgi:hypothetical protein
VVTMTLIAAEVLIAADVLIAAEVSLAAELRVRALGMDPATGRFRPNEAVTAVRLERHLNIVLTRAPRGSRADWFDEDGTSYDAVGPFEPCYFERQWPRFSAQIELHLKKADLVPVDVSQFIPPQVTVIEKFIAARRLAPRAFIIGRPGLTGLIGRPDLTGRSWQH